MRASETVEVTGHLMDAGILSRILDDIRDYGGDYLIEKFDLGHDANDSSSARITVHAEDEESLQRLLMRLQTRGVNQLVPGDAVTGAAEQDGVLPDGFYSTTNLPTRVHIDGAWFDVENPEMDCGLAIDVSDLGTRAFTVPMSDVTAGMQVVLGTSGVQVIAPHAGEPGDAFGLGAADVSVERPHAVLVRQVADGMRMARADGKRFLWVAGPGVVHTGAAPAMVELIQAGFVDVLFAGNAFAAHDIESALYGKGLGIDLTMGQGVEHGHEHHVRALNAMRKAGSISAAVDSGLLKSGIMHALVTRRATVVLVGSVRDDGPLPDAYTDILEAQRAMRAEVKDIGFCLMLATKLHGIAAGNILPASVPLVCVDINPAVVTKVADRGWSHARGIVTDVGLFLEQLALELIPDYRRG